MPVDAHDTATAAGATRPPRDDERLLRHLEWTVLRRLDGILQGDYRTLLRGLGLDFAGLREYQHDDDVRHIDWNVTARMNTPYVRQFSEDRDIGAWFLVDRSASADFGSARAEDFHGATPMTKRDLAVQFVALIARVLSRHGNRTAAMLYGEALDAVIPPGRDRRHVLHLLHRLRERAAATPSRTETSRGPTRLDVLLQRAATTLRRRSAVFIVSDFISMPGWEAPLAQLARRHDVMLVHITDPAEQQIPDIGAVILEDPETGEQCFIDTGDAAFRARYAALAAAHAAGVHAAAQRHGLGYLALSTGQSLVEPLVGLARSRKQRRHHDGTPRAVA